MKTRRTLLYIVMIFASISFAMPFIWLILMSVSSDGSLLISPSAILHMDFSFESYQRVFAAGFGNSVINSVVVSIATTFFQLLFAAMAGYALARFEFKGKKLIFNLILSLLMIPFIVIMIPLFIEMRYMNLVGTYYSMILPKIFSAFAIFFMRQFYLTLPRELEEAAYIDGCSTLRLFFTVILPQMKTPLATMGILAFMASWNDYLWPLVISNPDTVTLPVALANLSGQYTTDWSVVMAGAFVSMLPIIIVFIFGQKYMVSGMANTGNK